MAPGVPERWNWFLAANFSGKWIVTNGYAEIISSESALTGVLRFTPDVEPYAYIEAALGSAGSVRAVVTPSDSEAPAWNLEGRLHSDETAEGPVISIILTDGYTVFGLAQGVRSDEQNLA